MDKQREEEAQRLAYNQWAKSRRQPPANRAGTQFELTPERAVYVPTHRTEGNGELAVGGFYLEEAKLFQGGGGIRQIAAFQFHPPKLSLYEATVALLHSWGCQVVEMIDLPNNEVWVVPLAAMIEGEAYSTSLGKRLGVKLNQCQRFGPGWVPLDPRIYDQGDEGGKAGSGSSRYVQASFDV